MSTSSSLPSAQPHTILGSVIEICIATPNLHDTITELQAFGITPWKTYTFDPQVNISNATIKGRPTDFRLQVGFAELANGIVYEVFQPLSADTDDGTDIFSSWLQARNGNAGVHHIAYDLGDIPWEQRMQKLEMMGAEYIQGGTWHGKKGTCRFAWFRKALDGDNEMIGSTSTFFETIKFSDDWEDPEPDVIV